MDDEQPKQSTDDRQPGGIDLQAGSRRVTVDAETSRKLLDHVGPYLRWIVLAIAFSITTLSIFYGISLIWT